MLLSGCAGGLRPGSCRCAGGSCALGALGALSGGADGTVTGGVAGLCLHNNKQLVSGKHAGLASSNATGGGPTELG